MNEQLYMKLIDILGDTNALLNEPMKNHTTFRIGGPADYFVTPDSLDGVSRVIALANETGIPYFIMGNGSNLLVSDDGYRGMIIHIGKKFSKIEHIGDTLIAQAGVPLAAVAKEALNQGLTGFEFAGGIPGTLGGAVSMNAGAYGGEMKHVLLSVKAIAPDGSILEIDAKDMRLGYRTSIFSQQDYLVAEAVIGLKPGNVLEISNRMEELALARKTKQPLEYPSAGSTFKRPEGYFAGKLIQDSGLRGYQVGGAQVSDKHCGFVINAKDATSKDVVQLMRDVIDKVQQQFGVTLEPEIKLLGHSL